MKPAKRKCRARVVQKPRTMKSAEVIALMPSQPLALVHSPEHVIANAKRAADELKKILDAAENPLFIRGERYLRFEEWQTAARFLGVTARPSHTDTVTIGEHHGFKATADALLVSTRQIISSADAMCLTDEPRWLARPVYAKGERGKRVHTHDEPVPHFQRLSMAQTRACAKALRNVCAWVVVLAGYNPTPAEEMDTFNQDVGFGACGRCAADMYFADEGKAGICRTCQGRYEKDIKAPNFVADSVARVQAVKEQMARQQA